MQAGVCVARARSQQEGRKGRATDEVAAGTEAHASNVQAAIKVTKPEMRSGVLYFSLIDGTRIHRKSVVAIMHASEKLSTLYTPCARTHAGRGPPPPPPRGEEQHSTCGGGAHDGCRRGNGRR